MHPSSSTSSTDRPRLRLWGWPIVLGLLTASGLITALVSDRWGDWWSWIGLGVPMAVIAWFSFGRTRSPSQRREQQ